MPEVRGVDFEVIEVPPSSKCAAIAPAGPEGNFLVFFSDGGFKHLNLNEDGQRWSPSMTITGSISPEHGLFPYTQGTSKWVSFVEKPPKSFVCYTLGPSEQAQQVAEVSNRISVKGDIVSVCALKAFACILISASNMIQIRFVELNGGQAAGKFTKVPDVPHGSASSAWFMSPVGPRAVACMSQVRPGANPHFWICELDELNNVNTGARRTLKIGSIAHSLGDFNVLESISAGSVDGQIILSWKKPALTNGFLNGNSHTAHLPAKTFSVANLLCKDPSARALAAGGNAPIQTWQGIGTYLLESWTAEPQGDADPAGSIRFRLRDSKFGLFVTGAEVTLTQVPRGNLMLASSEKFAVASTNGNFVGIRFTLPSYSLQRAICQDSKSALKKKRKLDGERITAGGLAKLVKSCQGPNNKDASAIKSEVEAEDLDFVLQTLVSWLAFRRDLSPSTIRSNAPGIPVTSQITRFLIVLIDAFPQSLCRLPPDSIQKVIERLVTAGNEYTCHEKLLAKAAAACCERPAKQRKTTRGRVEVSMLNF